MMQLKPNFRTLPETSIYQLDTWCVQANRLGKWALGEVNIYDESFFNHAGSPQERFHLRCNQVGDTS